MRKYLLLCMFILLSVPTAHAYIVDGSVADWGINLGSANAKFYLDSHLPNGNAQYVTEDNADKNSGSTFVGPGYASGNNYDAEAMYLNHDALDLYLAIVTGVSKTEATYPAGDIFFDTGKYQNLSSAFYDPKKYEYGIDIATSKLYRVTSWLDPISYGQSTPYKIGVGRTFLSDVDFVYSGNQNGHYVLESKVALSLLGLSTAVGNPTQDLWLHWTMYCGNDELELKGKITPVPEPASLALLSSGLLMGIRRFRRK